ncbi:MAG: sensor domain-containing diguanylate cyclase [Acidimicrobiales bacterium]
MTAAEDQFSHDLRLAREISLGRAAFLALPEGHVVIDQLPGEPTHLTSRVESLARDCLTHPGARTHDLFWNARVVPDADTTDDSVACVAIGLERDGAWLGLLGVADSWLPELDAEQRESLIALAGSLARFLFFGAKAQAVAVHSDGAGPKGEVTDPRLGHEWPTDATPSLAPPAQALGAPAEAHDSSEGFLGEVVDHLPEALVVARDDGTIIYANQQFSAITGLAPDVLLGGDAVTLFGPNDPLSSAANWPEDIGSLLGAPSPGRRLSVASADDGYIPVDAYGRAFTSRVAGACHVGLIRQARGELGTGGSPTAHTGSTNTTATGQAGTPTATTQTWSTPATRLAVVELLDALDEGILMCDAGGTVLIANRAARTLQGLPLSEQLVGRPYPRATRLLTPDGAPLAGPEYPLEQALQGAVVAGEQFVLDAQGDERRHILASARPVTVEDGGQGALLVLRDSTPQVQSEAWLTHLAMHDALTGLANRHLLIEHVRRMLDQTGNRGSTVSLVYMDLDGFKDINDTHGHEAGDGVLLAVAQRLKAVVRPTDVVARLGGDEFVVAHTSSAPTDNIEGLVSRIRKSLAAPFRVHPHVLTVGASVGYVSTSSDEDPLSLLVRADREMFRHKRAARSASMTRVPRQ